MSNRVLATGTVVCSAIAFYGWAQPSTHSSNCNHQPQGTPPKSTTDIQQQCAAEGKPIVTGNTPERLLHLLWGNRGTEQLPKEIEASYESRLQQSQKLADREQFAPALSMIAGIPTNSHHYQAAQQFQEDWSQELLERANRAWKKAEVNSAQTLLKAIPETSSLRNRVMEMQTRLSQQTKTWNRAIAAQKSNNWQGTINAIKELEGTPLYNSLAVQNLLQEAIVKLYEPDQNMLQIATMDLSTNPALIAPPEAIPGQNL
jgi:hypothetical protein